MATIWKAETWENTPVVLMNRVLALDDGDPITQADISTLQYKAYEQKSLTQVNASSPSYESLTVSNQVYDSLQTGDSRWDYDTVGYNFLWIAPGSIFADGGKTYRIELEFTTTPGVIMLVWEVRAKSSLSL